MELLLKRICSYANEKPDKLAIITKNKKITYKELFENILKVANILSTKELNKNDVVIFENTQDEYFCYILFAINLLNYVALPVDKDTPINRIDLIKNKVDAKLILDINEIKENIVNTKKIEKYNFPNLDDPSILLLSSGSTGKEKVIEYSNETIYHIVKVYKDLYSLKDNNIILPTGPICRAYSLTRLYISFYYGLSLYIYDSSNIVDLIIILSENKNIILSTNPTILHYLLTLFYEQFEACISNINIIESCTAPLSTADSKRIIPILDKTKFYNFYGATEFQIGCLDIVKYGHKKGCVGEPLKDVVIDILDESNKKINEDNKVGTVRISNKEYGYKYYNEKEKKYFFPGEIGYISNGLLYLVDREKNFFNINGYKISPNDIEDIVFMCDYILECVCYYNGVLSLDVVVNESFDIKQLKNILNDNLSKYQIPKRINIVDSLKKTSNGKIDRKKYNKTLANN